MYVNDHHGRHTGIAVEPGDATSQTADPGRDGVEFERSGVIGGFARLATAATRVRSSRPDEPVLLFHGGDTFSDDLLGNLTGGEAVVRLMNAVGFDFLALGNHDFDYGVERTRALQQLAEFPMRAANVTQGGKPFLGEPYQVFDAGGVRVATLALGYHNTPWTASEKLIEGLTFSNGVEATRRLVPRLRERADAVVVVSHQGPPMDAKLAREVPGIDLILAAHSHDWPRPPRRVNGVPTVQALSDGLVLADVRLRVSPAGDVAVDRVDYEPLWADRFEEDAEIAALVAELRAPHRGELEEVVGRTSERIGRQYASPSPFDHLVGRMLTEEFDCRAAILPGVGYGVSLPKGDVTRERLYTLLPHPAKVVVVEMTGQAVLDTLAQSAFNQNPPEPRLKVGGIVQTPGVGWRIDLTKPIGERVSDVTIAGRPLEPGATYRIATHTGPAGGVHRYRAVAAAKRLAEPDVRVNELVERRLGAAGVVSAPDAGGACTLIPAPNLEFDVSS
ncbi:bifunctional metallophosphatase/5'-nucleotidase [Alienimonas sp. DA493]|uniref:bifunctional metallophosphatase/5'-nucleotidase n=1 Tax=Alienimonas sp. DA493 TaxID=3373605 RepID=UPI003754BE54